MTLAAEGDQNSTAIGGVDETAASAAARRLQQTAEESTSRHCRRLDSVLNPRSDGPTPDDARLAETARLFRRLRPEQFCELARVHLAFLLDLPHFEGDEDSGDVGGGGGGRRTSFRLLPRLPGLRRLAVRSQSSLPASSFSPSSTPKFVGNRGVRVGGVSGPVAAGLSLLMRHLHEADRYKTEGIFRKTGSCGRQKELQRCLLAGGRPQLDNFTVHDVASVLKQLLRCPDEPLLSDRHLEILAAIGDLDDKAPVDGKILANQPPPPLLRCRRLRAARLLMQLLPDGCARLLARLLRLLAAVAAAPTTRMTCAALGTVFGPALLGNSKSTEPSQVQKRIESLNSATAFLIANCSTIRLIPRTFAEDLKRHFDQLTAAAAAAASASATAEATDADSVVSTPTPSDDVYSQKQLAELIDHVSRLPPGCRDRRIFERRFQSHLLQQQQQKQQQQQQQQQLLTPKKSDSIRRRWRDTRHCDPAVGRGGIGRLLSFRKRLRQSGSSCAKLSSPGLPVAASSALVQQPQPPTPKSPTQQQHQRQPLLRRLQLLLAANSSRQSSRRVASGRSRRLVSSPKLTFCDVAHQSSACLSPSPSSFANSASQESTVFESPSARSSQQRTLVTAL